MPGCRVREHLAGFGGHRMAGGPRDRGAERRRFRAALVAHARGPDDDDLVKVERVDAVVPGDALGLGLAEELGRLRPFGMGNPGVSVLVPAARVSDVRPMGEGRHVRFTVTSGGVRSRAVGFGIGAARTARAATAEHATTSSRGSRRTSGGARSSRGSCSAPCIPRDRPRARMWVAELRRDACRAVGRGAGLRRGRRALAARCPPAAPQRTVSTVAARERSGCSATS